MLKLKLGKWPNSFVCHKTTNCASQRGVRAEQFHHHLPEIPQRARAGAGTILRHQRHRLQRARRGAPRFVAQGAVPRTVGSRQALPGLVHRQAAQVPGREN